MSVPKTKARLNSLFPFLSTGLVWWVTSNSDILLSNLYFLSSSFFIQISGLFHFCAILWKPMNYLWFKFDYFWKVLNLITTGRPQRTQESSLLTHQAQRLWVVISFDYGVLPYELTQVNIHPYNISKQTNDRLCCWAWWVTVFAILVLSFSFLIQRTPSDEVCPPCFSSSSSSWTILFLYP